MSRRSTHRRQNTILLVLVLALIGGEVFAQRYRRGGRNRNYYYQPSNRAYYGVPNPYYRRPTQSYFYYPPKYYPRSSVPFRGTYPARPRLGGPAYYRGSGATYYLSSPSAVYYPNLEIDANPVVRANFSHLIFNVSPGSALIFLDDKLLGSARSFGSERERYEVLEGEYLLRIEHPGYEPMETVLKIISDRTVHIDLELQQIPD